MCPLGLYTITLILFLVLLNSHTFKSLYFNTLSVSTSLMRRLSSMSWPTNSYPNYLAAFTSASSSGEAAVYVPFDSSITIVWHTLRKISTFTRASWF